MAFNPSELHVIRAYIALTGEAPTQQQLAEAFEFSSFGALTRSLVEGNDQSNVEFVTSLYENLLGREPDAEGLEYWASLMSSAQGFQALTKAEVLANFQHAAHVNGEAELDEEALEGLTSVDGEFGQVEEPEPPTDIQKTFTFNTAEGESDVNFWTNADGDSTNQGADEGIEFFQSQSHKIYNVGKEAIDADVSTRSADYTFEVKNQLGEKGAYEAYFLSPVLTNQVTDLGSTLTLEIIDRMADAGDKETALEVVAIQSFSFRLNGELVVVSSEDILNAATYADLRDAIEAELQAMAEERPELADIVVELGGEFTRAQVDPDTLETTGDRVLGDQIVLTAEGQELTRGGFEFGERSVADRNVDPSGRQDTAALGTEEDLISTNLELQNVGYGSQGGSVNLSGQSNSKIGIEQFNVDAQAHSQGLGVWLTSLASNPLRDAEQNALKVINLSGDAAYFHVGEQDGETVQADGEGGLTDVRAFNGGSFHGNIRLDAEVTHNVIARDLNLVDTQGNPANDNVDYAYSLGNGNNELYLEFSQEVIAHEDASLTITGGNGGNTIVTDLVSSSDNLETNWLADQQDLGNFEITTGSGNDVVWTKGEGDATISTGAGNDVIYTDNSGVQTGLLDASGEEFEAKAHWVFNNDSTVDDNNIFDLRGVGGENAVIGFMPKAALTVTFSGAQTAGASGLTSAAAAAFQNGFESVVEIPTGSNFEVTRAHLNQAVKDAINNDSVLSQLLVAKDGPDNTLIIESLIDGEFAEDDLQFSVGNTATDFTALTQSEQNQIESAFKSFSQDSTVNLADAQAANAASVTAAEGINPAQAEDAESTAIVGAASDANSNNTINAGSGNDVIVLGTESESSDTVVFEGSFGHNTIVNFDQDFGDGANASQDFLDFSAYLQSMVFNDASQSTSQESRGFAATDFSNSLGANDILVYNDFDDTSSANVDNSWGSLTGQQLLAALNDSNVSYGSIVNGTATADNAAAANGNAVGSTLDHLMFVENDNNDGEYKVFKLTSQIVESDAGSFQSAELVGIFDLGDTLTDFTAIIGQ